MSETFRFGPYVGRHMLVPLEQAALRKLDEAAALIAEAQGLLIAASEDERVGRTIPGSSIAGSILVMVSSAGALTREAAAKLDGKQGPVQRRSP